MNGKAITSSSEQGAAGERTWPRFNTAVGGARMICGALALAAAGIMSARFYPRDCIRLSDGWTALAFAAAVVYAAALWRCRGADATARRNAMHVGPITGTATAFLFALAITIAIVTNLDWKLWSMLFGVWLCSVGVIQMSLLDRPHAARAVSLLYIAAGTALLLVKAVHVPYTQPLIPALIFGVGEFAGGALLALSRVPASSWGRECDA